MSRPPVAYRLVQKARDSERPDEYEDAVEIQTGEWPVCAAVADGATESMYAKQWAETLVRGLVHHEVGTRDELEGVASSIRQDFHDRFDEATDSQPWYVSAKATEGAYATALGLVLEHGGRWRAVSIGDCCLFHVRDDHLHTVWPIDSVEAFDHRPELFPSLPSSEGPHTDATSGEWMVGDSFLLATDAVAQWLLRKGEQGTIWSDVLHRGKEGLEDAFVAARQKGNLRSDDATLLILDV